MEKDFLINQREAARSSFCYAAKYLKKYKVFQLVLN